MTKVNSTVDVLIIAAWYGLLVGLVEGILFLVIRQLGTVVHVTVEIVWISAVFNLLLFGFIGLGLFAMGKAFRRLPIKVIAVFVFILLALADWISVLFLDRLQVYAVFILALGVAVEAARRFQKHERAILGLCSRSLPWIAAITLLVLVSTRGALYLRERLAESSLQAGSQGSPNVLVVVVDTLRADHLSSYGYERSTSPNIDRVAENGVLFENAVATAPYTLPSHVSLLTGRFTFEHGVEWSNPKALIDSPYPTLAEALRARGYRTAAISANTHWFTSEFGFDRGFIRFEDYFQSISDMVFRTAFGRAIEKLLFRRLGVENWPGRRWADDITNAAARWIDRDQDKPFFLFLNYMDAHDPYLPPQPYRSMFSNIDEPGGALNCYIGRCSPELAPEQVQGEIDAYDGAIAFVDEHIGRLLSEFESRGLREETLLIIVSDHGEAFGEHEIYLHGNSLYRELLHVPMIFSWPEHVPAGARVETPVSLAALPVTVMDLLSIDAEPGFPGSSLALTWSNDDNSTEWPFPLAELEQQHWKAEKEPVTHGSMKSLVSPQWHYIDHEVFGVEVYDWQNDVEEQEDLSGRSEFATLVAELGSRLDSLVGEPTTRASAR